MEDNNNRNFIVAIVLSGMVLLLWQFFYAAPQMEKERLRKQQEQEQALKKAADGVKPGATVTGPSTTPTPAPGQPGAQAGSAPTVTSPGTIGAPSVPGALPTALQSREAVLKASPRIAIDTPSLIGSLNLKGGRIDDLVLRKFHVEVDKSSPEVVFFSPSGAAHPLYAQHGWAPADSAVKTPNDDSIWTQEGSGDLTPGTPVALKWDNGAGLTFRRTVSVDENYMFKVTQQVENNSGKPVTLFPYALISRHEQPTTEGFYILHEGLIGVLGEDGLHEVDYGDLFDDGKPLPQNFKAKTGGWIGITDKYWATAVIPNQKWQYDARFMSSRNGASQRFQADYLLAPITVPSGGKGEVVGELFAGAKKVEVIDGYAEQYGISQFDLMIDWGWFYFITKPMFHALAFFQGLIGNFGVAILIVTVLIKLVFYPLANKSYESMSKMKKLQPEMERIRKRYGDDKVKQQQEMMALYQKEGANPLSGCLPILIQIPVFFALYKVLFVSLEMRHAPFFGWIQDLSAKDPTSLFNLFGLLPYGVPDFLTIGIWPLLMGITMWIQMKLNPQQTDPTQQMIFNWMPVIFTFMLAAFPAGLVIYWAWNNFLSVVQQWHIMRKNDVEVDLLENTGLKKLIGKLSEKAKRS